MNFERAFFETRKLKMKARWPTHKHAKPTGRKILQTRLRF